MGLSRAAASTNTVVAVRCGAILGCYHALYDLDELLLPFIAVRTAPFVTVFAWFTTIRRGCYPVLMTPTRN